MIDCRKCEVNGRRVQGSGFSIGGRRTGAGNENDLNVTEWIAVKDSPLLISSAPH